MEIDAAKELACEAKMPLPSLPSFSIVQCNLRPNKTGYPNRLDTLYSPMIDSACFNKNLKKGGALHELHVLHRSCSRGFGYFIPSSECAC